MMNSYTRVSAISSRLLKTSAHCVLGLAFACLAVEATQIAMAQNAPETTSMPDFAPAMIDHMQKMRRYKDHDHGAQPTRG